MPVIVIVKVPRGDDALGRRLRVLVLLAPATETEDGVNVAVTPAGRPLADSVTVPLKEEVGVTVIVVFAPLPGFLLLTLTVEGEADSEKFGAGGAVTTRVALAVCTRLPLVPVIVSG
jgi:hypothetical protein